MLKQLSLKRFKKFKETSIQFAPFTVMMGENSSGKTTILQATNLAIQSLSRLGLVYNDHNGVVKIRRKGVGLASLPGLSLANYREIYYGKLSRGGTTPGAGGAEIELVDHTASKYKLQITSLFGGSFNIKCLSSPNEVQPTAILHKKTPLFISGFVGLRATEERAFPVAIHDRLRAGHVSHIIRNLILDTKEAFPDRFRQLSERLRQDFGFHLDNVLFNPKTDLHVLAQYKDACETAAVQLDFTSSGSGFMQVLQILAPIYRFCPEESDIVLLDEPDAHLHPNLQTDLARTLRAIQKELNIQIIISTHSTSIIRSAHPSEVVPIATGSYCRPLSSIADVESQIVSSIDSYHLGKSVISGKMVFMEDTNTRILEKMDKLLGTRALTGPNTVPIISGRGKDDKVPYQIREVLKTYLDKDVEIHVIRDSDGMPNEWLNKIEQHGHLKSVYVHHIPLYEVESFLLNPKLILRALEHLHGGKQLPDAEMITVKIDQALRDTIQMARYRYENVLQDCIYKTALVLGLDEYRNPTKSLSEAAATRASYEAVVDSNRLLVIGMGKEAFKVILNWINADLRLALSQQDLIESLERADIPGSIEGILSSIRSLQLPDNVDTLPVVAAPEVDDDDSPGSQLELIPN